MRKMKFYIFSLILTAGARAGVSDEALRLVPGGKVIQSNWEEVKVQTPSGSIVEVEFEHDGSFEEASGNLAERDVLVPGGKTLSLKAAVKKLKESGKNPVGDWSLEKSMLRGWYYEFEGFENNRKMEYTVDAGSGELIDAKLDD